MDQDRLGALSGATRVVRFVPSFLSGLGALVEILQHVGHFTRLPCAKNGPHTMVALVFLCRVMGGELTLSHEGLALAYRAIDDVQHWHATPERYARSAWAMW